MRKAQNIDRPDMTKADIQKIMKSLKRYWSRTPKDILKNRSYLAALSMMSFGIAATPDATIVNLWYKMMLAFQLMTEAGMVKQMREDGFGVIADRVCEKIESGELFSDLPDE